MGLVNQEIVVVDDNRVALSSMNRFLRRRGFEPVTFATSSEAEHHLESRSGPPAGALFDVWLDRGSVGVALALLLVDRFRVPVAFVTGYSIAEAVETWRGRRTGQLDMTILPKPLDWGACKRFLLQAAIGGFELDSAVHRVVLDLSEGHDLHPQEARILAQLAMGTKRADLAHELDISPDTVKWQVRGLISKLEVCDAAEATTLILRVLNGHNRSNSLGPKSNSPDWEV
jgi:DNA-binding NarL/FixJ family response regulator